MNEISRAFHSGYPVLRVAAWEEDDAAHLTRKIAVAALGPGTTMLEWDAADGLEPRRAGVESLDQVLDAAAHDPGPSLWLLRDALPLLANTATLRRLRRLTGAIGSRPVRVVLLTPPGDLPEALAHHLPTASLPLPDHAALVALVEEEVGQRIRPELPARLVASALLGLTGAEARAALRRAVASGELDQRSIARLFEEKASRVEGQSLEYYPPETTLDQVGGLEGMKDWARKREPAFRGAAGARPPRGILLTGVSGCGKSHSVKALASLFAAPLFRLDMTRIFGRPEPEAAFSRALDAVTAMAPCLLWIDEIENAFALGTLDSGVASRIAGSFLTWLQERPDGVFVAATANRIELLPAELLRRGRFDQIFFVDLPDEEDRKRIWAIHLGRRGAPVANFDLVVLAKSTPAWTAAEIEAAVDAAMVEAAADLRPLAKDHLFKAIGRTVPLSTTMKEQIRRIKEWAHDRAASASGRSL